MGYRAKDEKLLDYFLNGDGYVGVAKEIFKKEVEKDTPIYKTTKSVVLGVNYGMDDWKMAKDLWEKEDGKLRFSSDWDTHLATTQKVRRLYLRQFKGVKRYIRYRHAELAKTQQVISPTGRVRHLPHHGPDSEGYWHLENQAVNFPIQSMAADVTGAAVVDFEAALLKRHGISYADWTELLIKRPLDLPCSVLFNEVHDELDMDMHPDTGKADLEILLECMRSVPSLRKLVPGFDLKFNVDVAVGDTWK